MRRRGSPVVFTLTKFHRFSRFNPVDRTVEHFRFFTGNEEGISITRRFLEAVVPVTLI